MFLLLISYSVVTILFIIFFHRYKKWLLYLESSRVDNFNNFVFVMSAYTHIEKRQIPLLSTILKYTLYLKVTLRFILSEYFHYYDLYFNRDQEYMTKTFPKYDPTARDKFISVVHTPGDGGYYRNSLVFLTIPGLEDTAINDILVDIDTVKIADVDGGKSSGLTVELLLEDESQEKSITERLLFDGRVTEVGKSSFFTSDDTPPVSDVSTQNPTTAQDPTTTLPRTGDGSLGFLGIIAVLILSCGSFFTVAYRSHRRSY